MTFPLQISNLTFRYLGRKENIIEDINLTLKKGEIVGIVGLSGSGKSTLCYCMSGVVPHVYKGEFRGEVLINGVSTTEMKLPEIATKLGIVFQNPDTQLFFPLIEDEIAFGPENLCIERDEIGRRIKEVLSLVGMKEYYKGNSKHLSGGQKQLIVLASVLSLQPDIIIFDEVMSQIDKEGKKRIKNIICNLKKAGKAVIMVEHDLKNLHIADSILELYQGRIKNFEGALR